MNILVTANQVPFMKGGADYHVQGVVAALEQAGHSVELVRFPFRFSPDESICRLMDFCRQSDFNEFNGIRIDRLISLQFPGYGVRHDNHRIWVMHQHRAVYDLLSSEPSDAELSMQARVAEYDRSAFSSARKIFANSRNVAARLLRFNGVSAEPLYHPPAGADLFYCDEPYDYIFYPSRLESLKRQALLIQAAAFVRSPVRFLIAGSGGQRDAYEAQIRASGVGDRVHLIGAFSEQEKYALYARALAVFFGPFDEDYGYITLEAMLSGKPVITCADSGGPLEFVRDGETGLVCSPEPKAVAEAIDRLYSRRQLSRELGQNGLLHYRNLNIRWSHVVDTLLQES